MPKCLRLGWSINVSPTPLEQGVWKRHYIQTVQELRLAPPQVRRSVVDFLLTIFLHNNQVMHWNVYRKSVVHPQTALSHSRFAVPDAAQTSCSHDETSESAFLSEETPASDTQKPGSSSSLGFRKEKQLTAPPPWRDSDRYPKDTHRFNYLDNLDPNKQAWKM